MVEQTPLREVVVRLERNGHRIATANGHSSTGVSVLSAPQNILTVALEPDPVVKELYRQRFFLCTPDADAILLRAGCQECLRSRWTKLLSQVMPGCQQDFLAGPATWTLAQLSSHDRILIWANDPPPWTQDYINEVEREWGI